MVALRQVIHRVVEPILLVFGRRADYAAAHDLLEQLVPGLRKRSCRSDWLLPESVFLSVHQFGWSKNVYENRDLQSTGIRHHFIEERFMQHAFLGKIAPRFRRFMRQPFFAMN